jgi:hypothetical protein
MNDDWKEFGRKWPWSNLGIIPEFARKDYRATAVVVAAVIRTQHFLNLNLERRL